MNRSIKLSIINPGLQTTIQDHGREQHRAFGVPKAGPMDIGSAKLANRLVGNPELNPIMEITVKGPEIEISGDGYLSLTGAQFKAVLDGEPLIQNKAIAIKGTHALTIGNVQSGCRGYLAVSGTWDLESWLGSCSTSPQNAAELTPGSVIKKGACITIVTDAPQAPKSVASQGLNQTDIVRILAGPEYNLFETAVIKDLLSQRFSISSQSNRMGYRLESPLKNYHTSLEIISSGVVPGTVQVTHSGQLIILMADAQTTGGYPRIANVVTEDLDILAQKKPGDSIYFKVTSLNEFSP